MRKESDEVLDLLVKTAKKKKGTKKDKCYYKVKSRYKKWPSAYASGALVKCRQVGAANWEKVVPRRRKRRKNLKSVNQKSKKANIVMYDKYLDILEKRAKKKKKKKKSKRGS